MILITGGAFQGKTAYAMSTFSMKAEDFADGRSCDLKAIFRVPGISHFHEYIRRCMNEGREISGLVRELTERNPDVLIIVNELGCGVVPVEAFDREYRETVGRISCELAKEAREVHRVLCGIGMVIKHG